MKREKINLILAISTVIEIAFIIILLVLIYTPDNPSEDFNFEILNSDIAVQMDYPGMKFAANQITYAISDSCNISEKTRMENAFKILSNLTLNINFTKVYSNQNILVVCSDNIKGYKDYNYFNNMDKDFGGIGGPFVNFDGNSHEITGGIIWLYNDPYPKCSKPITEMHELLHVFGFRHSTNEKSVMYPINYYCDQKIDNSIIGQLNNLYS